jgi:sulfite reductase alpha subunit-like flavoprotein
MDLTGDSSYVKFNAVARKLRVRLQQLGAIELGAGACYSDDQARYGYLQSFYPWMEKLSSNLEQIFGDAIAQQQLSPNALVTTRMWKSAFDVTVLSDISTEGVNSQVADSSCQSRVASPGTAYSANNGGNGPFFVNLVGNDRMTDEDWTQNVRHVVLESKAHTSKLVYSPGDVLAIYPQNPDDDVVKFCRLFQLDPQAKLSINLKDMSTASEGLPSVLSVYDLFKKHLDISGTPRR